MATMQTVREQLTNAGFKNRYLGMSAVRQLPNVMVDDEIIEKVVSGIYDGGYAIMVATNKRILFLDKKPMTFVLEDVPYDKITEVEYHINPFNAHLTVHCQSKKITIKSMRQASIQAFAIHTENQVNQVRTYMANWAQSISPRSVINRSEVIN